MRYDHVKMGLEIHQQLDTERKLFCHCPAQLVKNDPTFKTMRYMRPTLSETGEVDPTVLKAFKGRKKIIYSTYTDENCLYEINEAPPYEINRHALETALFISKMMRAHVPDVIPISRKQYLDGSVPSGFQRTMIVGFNGELPLSSGKKIKIEQICLEEDAARRVEEDDERVIFSTDRLGIPLIEVTTAPQLSNPEEVRDAALRLGGIFRSTGNARRGIGSIRQDLNISIEGGSRVEIKGVQRPEWFKPLIDREIRRQQNLKDLSERLVRRGVTEKQIESQHLHDVSSAFSETKSTLVKKALRTDKKLFAIRLPGFKGLLSEQIQKGKTFGKEFAERVTVTVGLGGILHTDELPDYEITTEEKKRLFEVTDANREHDTVVVVIGRTAEAEDAVEEIKERAIQSLSGVPEETRKAHRDGTTSFERPLGTAARLYPDTDTPPLRISASLLDKVENKLENAEYPWEKKEKYQELGLSERHAKVLALSQKSELFEKVTELDVDPKLAATILVEKMKELEREGYDMDLISDAKMLSVFKRLEAGEIAKEAIPDILMKIAENPEKEIEAIIEALGIERISREELERIVNKLIEANKDYVTEEGEAAFNGLMGDLMTRVKGEVDGAIAAKVLRERLTFFLKRNQTT